MRAIIAAFIVTVACSVASAAEVSAARGSSLHACWKLTLAKWKWKPTDKPDTQQDATYRNCMAGHRQLP
jgi:hypothetical protein